MARDDLDLGSAGVMLLPDQPGIFPHVAVTTGKNGHVYVLNRDSLGGYNAGLNGNPQVIQEVSGQLRQQMGTPAYWNGRLYFGAGISPHLDGVKAFALHNGTLSATPVSQSAAIYHLTRSTVSVSANGNGNGIVWAVDNDAYYSPHQGPAVLHAYDARNLAHELYNSNRALRPRQSRPGIEVHGSHRRQWESVCRHREPAQRVRIAFRRRQLARSSVRILPQSAFRRGPLAVGNSLR